MRINERKHPRLERAIERHDRDAELSRAQAEFQRMFLDYELKSSRVILLINCAPAGRLRTWLIGLASWLVLRRATRKFAWYLLAEAVTREHRPAADATKSLIVVP